MSIDKVRGKRLKYRHFAGGGRDVAETHPILFVPGLNCTAELFSAQVLALSMAHPCLVADHGAGETIGEVATAILAAAPARFALCGLSMGGYVAFEILRRAPERVTRVALLDTTARADTPEQTAARRANLALAAEGRFQEVVDRMWPRFVHPARLEDAALRAIYTRMALETGPEGFTRQTKAIMSRPDSRPFLNAIAKPTLVFVGENDAVTPVESAREIADAIPGANLQVLPHCGHLSTIEMPGSAAQALRAWMAG
jgi:pimeloyl-ACP methyl ester carboxylesterase